MSLFDIGRLCLKIAGRDAGRKCVVVDKIDDHFVLIDGNVRRRKCNITHLEPKNEVLKIKKGASTAEVHKIMSAAGIKVVERKKVKRSAKKGAPKKTTVSKK